jgi:NAD(P)-dependent dehydrogenase (short-subunit alcohol dehydrogenase family)
VQSLDNQRVLVIGGSSGIGLAIAAATSNAGASVTIASRNKEKLTTVAANLSGAVQIAGPLRRESSAYAYKLLRGNG